MHRPAAWESPRLGTCGLTNNGREPQNFIYLSIKSWNNPSNIPLPWNSLPLFCSQIPHPSPRVASTPIEQKPTSIGFIMCKHFTCTKLSKPARKKTEGKLPNPWDNTRKSCTPPSPKQEKQKDNNLRFTQGGRGSKPDQESCRDFSLLPSERASRESV